MITNYGDVTGLTLGSFKITSCLCRFAAFDFIWQHLDAAIKTVGSVGQNGHEE
jgi:hypothetical protein